ncbi:hypothetical protein Pla175_24580 [Pirellulimonas nuda]|uniref:Transposase n=1 Tax=Pirellulimonas nuda TaxID=2528009 RepID=A0A518DC57_9BACT|nr:helix-turn-helix domain-containing protein [Pirellulimonas nuda]QDU89072.1 hypothetical protein Pla175_24580 [Pirellulimonas nuda]
MAQRCDVSIANRREAVLKLLRREQPAAAIAREVGVSEPTLCRWRDELLAGGEQALSAKAGKHDTRGKQIAELEREIERRDQVIGEYTIANRILKKLSDASL